MIFVSAPNADSTWKRSTDRAGFNQRVGFGIAVCQVRKSKRILEMALLLMVVRLL